ncbi:cyclic nucleotide-binding domain-containing protein 2-like isoform X2 [Haliotis asinina]|uniref:cyclic nucleotide-binding domain-containing protein 2-like isoform X2 n=1 Tax=Haliotis asinina TaxID=109174 RepID=UPI003531F8FB
MELTSAMEQQNLAQNDSPLKAKMKKVVKVLCKQYSRKCIKPTGEDKFFYLAQTLMKEKLQGLPKYGIFADIEKKIDGVIESAVRHSTCGADDSSPRQPKNSLQRKRSIALIRAESPVEGWRSLRRDSQLPEFESYPCLWQNDLFMMVNDPKTQDAIRKSRSKISESLNLPGDRFARLLRLRQNVYTIEKKFRSFVNKGSRTDINCDKHLTTHNFGRRERPSRFKAPGEARMLFRKQARILLIAIKWLNYVFTKDHLNWEQELKTFADVAVEMQESTAQPRGLKDSGLSFDKNHYKANKEISLSADVRHYLSLTPAARTPEMLQQVLHGLQTLQSLSEYPLRTQERLCLVAWYQRVEAKKVIIRQGHYPECFYFILSGAAYVKKMVKVSESGEQAISTVARLTRGQSFGEVSLIFDSPRTATVESATSMELLVISKTDFLTIFMNADDPNEEADHIKFLRQIPVMKHWPIGMLKTEPGTCLLHYFKRGTLITDNGSSSEWLYFVKSGSCEAIKRLHAVKGRGPRDQRKHLNPLYDVILPTLSSGETASSRVDSGVDKRRRHRHVVSREVLESMKTYYDGIRREDLPSRIQPVPTTKQRGQPGVSKPRISEVYLTKHSGMLPTSTSVLQLLTPGRESSQTSEHYKSGRQQNQVFVKVDVLQSKDIFGMETLDTDRKNSKEDIPEMSLVSRGAEVVLLSKRIFLKYATDNVRRSVQEMARRYPREAALQDKLQIQADWDLYRQHVMADAVAVSRSTRSLPIVT